MKCKPLQRGSTLGIICPASKITNQTGVDIFLNMVQAYGFSYKLGVTMSASEGYLAGRDEQRAKDIMDMFLDNTVDAILCYKGGYGCSRIVDMLDYEQIAQHPKLLIGFSDVTVLLNAVYQKAHIPTLHGNMGCCLNEVAIDHVSVVQFFHTLLGINRPVLKNQATNLKVLVAGTAEGPIVGGNLSLVVNLIGTPFDIDVKDRILLLEDVDEEPYAIDRMFAQLRLSGKLAAAKGIILGKFTRCEPKNIGEQTVTDLIDEYFTQLRCPVIIDFETGHEQPFLNVPIGLPCLLDTTQQTLTILEPLFKNDEHALTK